MDTWGLRPESISELRSWGRDDLCVYEWQVRKRPGTEYLSARPSVRLSILLQRHRHKAASIYPVTSLHPSTSSAASDAGHFTMGIDIAEQMCPVWFIDGFPTNIPVGPVH